MNSPLPLTEEDLTAFAEYGEDDFSTNLRDMMLRAIAEIRHSRAARAKPGGAESRPMIALRLIQETASAYLTDIADDGPVADLMATIHKTAARGMTANDAVTNSASPAPPEPGDGDEDHSAARAETFGLGDGVSEVQGASRAPRGRPSRLSPNQRAMLEELVNGGGHRQYHTSSSVTVIALAEKRLVTWSRCGGGAYSRGHDWAHVRITDAGRAAIAKALSGTPQSPEALGGPGLSSDPTGETQ